MNITLETKSGKYLIKSDDNQFIMSELKTSTKEGSKSFGTEQECSKRYYPKLSQLVSALVETEMKTSDAFDLKSLVDTVCRIENCIITKIKEA